MKKKNTKELIIIGGPNGSGKTTLAREFLENKNNYQYLSADDIAFEINPDNPASVRSIQQFIRPLDVILQHRRQFSRSCSSNEE